MKKYDEFDGFTLEEFLLLTLQELAGKGLVLSQLQIEPDVYRQLEMNLGSKVNRSKKGWIKLFGGNRYAGIPAFEVTIKPRKP